MMCFELTDKNAVALEVIQERHPTPVYPTHLLKKGTIKKQYFQSKTAEGEAKKRDEIRETYEELSRYFEVPMGCTKWVRPQLLLRGKYHRGRSQR